MYIFDQPADLKRLSEMIFVEGGSFMLDTDYQVTLSSFYIGKYPATQALWKAVMKGENPSSFIGDNRPVERVSWFDAVVFCNVLNESCGYEPCYYSDKLFQHIYGKNTSEGITDTASRERQEEGYILPNDGEVYLKPNTKGYRLPTEAEWEYAARGGQKSGDYEYAGSDKLNEVGWFRDNSFDETKPVGFKLENELGIYDMSGNVWEWCYDWRGAYNKAAVTNPTGAVEGRYRVYRGGTWGFNARLCRPTYRGYYTPTYRDFIIGFRLVLVFPSV